jgi:hypothetical protein
LRSVVANFRKAAKETRRLETKTVEELVATNKWPSGGMPELQAAYLEHLPTILCAFDEGVETYRHNEEFFRSFMELLMFGKTEVVVAPSLLRTVNSTNRIIIASSRLLRIRPSGSSWWH